MTDDPMRPLIVRLPPELHQAVKDAARAADLSMAQWIRRAIRANLAPTSWFYPDAGQHTRSGMSGTVTYKPPLTS